MQSGIRSCLHGLAIALVLPVVVIATPTSALAAQPLGGCPQRFELLTVDKVVKMANPTYEVQIRAADRNADGYLCVKADERGGTYTDNNVSL